MTSLQPWLDETSEGFQRRGLQGVLLSAVEMQDKSYQEDSWVGRELG